MYLKDLQKRLIPIYNLTRKGVPFEWTNEHQKIFEGLKKDIANPPVLVTPNNKGHFTLVLDTSGVACGAALYQEQRGKLRLVGYNSKKLPPAAIRYSISELELCGLAVNIHSFKHILRNTEFTVIIDHSACLYILNVKREPPTLRLKKLIEVLSQYSFKVTFLRGKDMTVSDFLSRHPGQDLASPNEIIPISFQSKELLKDQFTVSDVLLSENPVILTLKDLQVESYEDEEVLIEYTLANPIPFKDVVECVVNDEKVHLTKEDLALSNTKIENWFTPQNKWLSVVLIASIIGILSFIFGMVMVKKMVQC